MRVSGWQWVRHHWIAVAIALSGAMVSASLSWLQWIAIGKQQELEVKEAVRSRWDAFRVEVKRAEDMEDAVVAFFETSEKVGREQFEAFAAKLPSVHFRAISFAAHVPAAKRAEFERRMRADAGVARIWELDAGGQRQPAAERDAYFPVTYLYPAAGNLKAQGFDLASEARRKSALYAAIETGKTTRTEPIRLVQDPEHWAFLVFKPVYVRPKHDTEGGARHPELVGIVSGVYQFRTFLDAVIRRTEIAGQHIALFDTTQPESPVYVHYSRLAPNERPDLEQPMTVIASAAGAVSADVAVMQREVRAVFLPAGVGVTWWRQINTTILATLVIGLLLTAALVWNHIWAYRLTLRLSEATEDLKAKKEEAERASVAKSRFLAAASHDLRQPMHALQLFAEGLHHEIRHPERAGPLILRLQESIGAMSGMLDALLDISGLEAGTLRKAVHDFPVQVLLRRVENMFAPLAVERGLRFRLVPSKAWIRSDPDLLARVVENFVSNAIKYTHSGGVVVGCRRRAGALSIEVWDSGTGIPRAHQAEIFQEYFQLENPERDRSKGLGLGLAIVDRIARLLDHQIRMRSVPGRGSMFAVDVPYGERATHVGAPAEIKDLIHRFAGVRVAVIDDESEIVDATRQLLERWGCVVIGASSEAEMLELLGRETRAPDFLICDYRLRHGGDGLSAIRNVRLAAGKDLPAVLISGDTSPHRAEDARASGIEMLQKPVAPARLRQLMQRQLSRQNGPNAT